MFNPGKKRKKTTSDRMASENDEILCWVSIISDVINILFGLIFIPLTIFKFYESHSKSVHIKKSIGYITITFFSISSIVPMAWILFRAESCLVIFSFITYVTKTMM